jgi:hypothetical protein
LLRTRNLRKALIPRSIDFLLFADDLDDALGEGEADASFETSRDADGDA